jgi:hypothetical protein
LKRSAHAVGRVVITRSGSGRTQFNYPELMGGVSAAAISTYTCHAWSEQNFSNVMSVYATQMGWDAVTYMIKEFWPDLRKKSAKNNHCLHFLSGREVFWEFFLIELDSIYRLG